MSTTMINPLPDPRYDMFDWTIDYDSLDETEPPRPPDNYVAYRWERFVLAGILARYWTLEDAAEYAGVPMEVVRQRLDDSPQFSKSLEGVQKKLRNRVEREVVRRALEPVEVPIFGRGGRQIGVKLEYDNRLLMWVAERMIPEKFHIPSRLEAGNTNEEIRFKLELTQGRQEDQEE